MWVYPASYYFLHLEPTFVQKIFIYVSCIAFAVGVIFLVKSLIPGSSSAVTVGATVFAILTETVNGNLARFGQGNFSLGQYYGFAVALQMVVISFAFRGRIIKCAICLAALLWMHPLIAAITGFVAGVILFAPSPDFKIAARYVNAILLVCCSAGLYLFVMRESATDKNVLSFEEWINWVRFFNFHWFPFDLGVFSKENQRLVAPSFAILLLAFAGLTTKVSPEERQLKWLAAVIVCGLLIIIGLINSITPVSKILTMASFHRTSGILLLLALPFACQFLYESIRQVGLTAILAVVVITAPLLGTYGFPLLPSTALFCLSKTSQISRQKNWEKAFKFLKFLILNLAIANIIWLLFKSGTAYLNSNLLGTPLSWILGGIFGFLIVASINRKKSKILCPKINYFILFVTLGILCVLRAQDNWKRHPLVDDKRLALDYLEAQIWARNNTPPGSLFLTDPTICYGWKDYSARPSWGNYRDWLHSCIAYHSDSKLFKEGLRRAKKLGVDPEEYLKQAKELGHISPNSIAYANLYSEIKNAFRTLEDKKIQQLAAEEKINFMIYNKKDIQNSKIPVIYENKSFKIIKLQ